MELLENRLTSWTPIAPHDARDRWAAFRGRLGLAERASEMLTSPDGNTKLAKNVLPTYGLTLLPHTGSGFNACPHATDGCAAVCLNTSGRGKFTSVQAGREAKTLFLAADPDAALTIVQDEVDRAVKREGKIALRLNVLSDLRWERIAPAWFTRWGDAVTFYDYTKWPRRDVPDNYHLTYSWHENARDLAGKLDRFGRVAVVFDEIPDTWQGVECVNGDLSDQRWNDNRVIVALKAKGDAKGDTSGFVQKGAA